MSQNLRRERSMTSYVFDIGEKARKASRFIGHVRMELQKALVAEKAARKITQQQIANQIGVNRSVINRQLTGTENLTLRSVAELAWALGWDIDFALKKPINHGNHQQRVEIMHIINTEVPSDMSSKQPVEIYKKPDDVSISVYAAAATAA